MNNRLIPDSECKQGKCGATTTGCVGKCAVDYQAVRIRYVSEAELDKANARIAQLEDALTMMLEAGESENEEDWFAAARTGSSALTKQPTTWLSDHDKAVEARLLEDVKQKVYEVAPYWEVRKWIEEMIESRK